MHNEFDQEKSSDEVINKLSSDEKKLTNITLPDPNKESLEKLSTASLWSDFGAKIIIFIGFIYYVFWQSHSVSNLMNYIMQHDKKELSSIVITTYIKYSLTFNGAVTLILGYWFGTNGGFSKLIHKIISGIIKRE